MANFDPTFMIGSFGCTKAFSIDHVSEDDKLQYVLCAHLWCKVVESYAGTRLAVELRTVINTVGLYYAIRSADAAATDILDSGFATAPYNRDELFGLWLEICTKTGKSTEDRYVDLSVRKHLGEPAEDRQWRASAAFGCGIVLRFPKRFTVCDPGADNLADFEECQEKAYAFSDDWSLQPGSTLFRHVARNIARILDVDPMNLGIYEAFAPTEVSPFSSGACFYPGCGSWLPGKTSRSRSLKYAFACLSNRPDLVFEHYLGSDWLEALSFVGEAWPDYAYTKHLYSAKLGSVPKSYKERRMIAPETPVLNAIARRVRWILFQIIDANGFMPFLNPTNQDVNKAMARLGSVYSTFATQDGPARQDLRYCTLDARHASDSIPRKFFFELLYLCPPRVRYLIRLGLADELYYKGRFHKGLPILATSGSPLTPILQSVYYCAIMMTVHDLCGIEYEHCIEPYALEGGIVDGPIFYRRLRRPVLGREYYKEWDRIPFTCYNDDIVVTEPAFECACEMLQSFNITINATKTFHGANPYRESCGGEFIAGVDVTGCYWPRKPITFNNGKLAPESISSLVRLQHRLFEVNAVEAYHELGQFLLEAVPSMTVSRAYAECDDVWVKWRTEFEDATEPHLRLTETYSRGETYPITEFGVKCLEICNYLSYLSEGPQYATYLDEVLGISVARDSHKHADEVSSPSYKKVRPSVKVDR